jgi:hypothetical protein
MEEYIQDHRNLSHSKWNCKYHSAIGFLEGKSAIAIAREVCGKDPKKVDLDLSTRPSWP